MAGKFFSIWVSVCLIMSVFSFSITAVQAEESMINREDSSVTLEEANQVLQSSSNFFTENKGQWPEEILFMGDTDFGKIAFTHEAVYYQLVKTTHTTKDCLDHNGIENQQGSEVEKLSQEITPPWSDIDRLDEFTTSPIVETQTIKLSFVNAQTPTIQGKTLLPHYNNYFIGNDPDHWGIHCNNYTQVNYTNVWDNIDLSYFFTPQGMKYEYYVHPGADIQDLQVQVLGADLLSNKHCLELFTSLGNLRDDQLLVYGQNSQSHIQASFKVIDDIFSFALENPETCNETIVIDPIVWSTYIGGNENELEDVCPVMLYVESENSFFVSGNTSSIDFNAEITNGELINDVYTDYYVCKISKESGRIDYVTVIGGSQDDGYNSTCKSLTSADLLMCDHYLHLYGTTRSKDLPNAKNTFNGGSNFPLCYDCFLGKINPASGYIVESLYIGGTNDDFTSRTNDSTENTICSVWNNEKIIISGLTRSQDIDHTVNPLSRLDNASFDYFIATLDICSYSIEKVVYVGGTEHDGVVNHKSIAPSIQIDNEYIYLCGFTLSDDLPNSLNSTNNGSEDKNISDYFIAKIDITDLEINFVLYIGGEGYDCYKYRYTSSNRTCEHFCPPSLVLDEEFIYITGVTWSKNLVGSINEFYGNSSTVPQVFIAKICKDGKTIESRYITRGGVSGSVASYYTASWGATSLIISEDSVYVSSITGFNTQDFLNTVNLPHGYTDYFVTKIDKNDLSEKKSIYIGGKSDEGVNSFSSVGTSFYSSSQKIMFNKKMKRMYIVGLTYSDDLPNRLNEYSLDGETYSSRDSDFFVSEINFEEFSIVKSIYYGGDRSENKDVDYYATSSLNVENSIYIQGFTSSDNLPESTNQYSSDGVGSRDAFMVKLSLDDVPSNPIISDNNQIIANLPYINQREDTKDGGFDQEINACGATTAVMIANYYDRLPLLSDYPNATSKGYFVGNAYDSFGFTFNPQNNSSVNAGSYGYICGPGDAIPDWAESYFVKHGIWAEKQTYPSKDELWDGIVAQIDKSQPLYARGCLHGDTWDGNHIVTIVGYREITRQNGEVEKILVAHDPWWNQDDPWWNQQVVPHTGHWGEYIQYNFDDGRVYFPDKDVYSASSVYEIGGRAYEEKKDYLIITTEKWDNSSFVKPSEQGCILYLDPNRLQKENPTIPLESVGKITINSTSQWIKNYNNGKTLLYSDWGKIGKGWVVWNLAQSKVLQSYKFEKTEPNSQTPLVLVHGWQASKGGDTIYDERYISETMVRSFLEEHNEPNASQFSIQSLKKMEISNKVIADDAAKDETWDIYYYETQSPSIGNIYISNYNANVHPPEKNPTKDSILVFAHRLACEIKTISIRENDQSVDIVAHSMGGLVARTYVEYWDFTIDEGGRCYAEQVMGGMNHYFTSTTYPDLWDGTNSLVNKLIMLGTPNHGAMNSITPFSKFGAGTFQSSKEMVPCNPFLNILNYGVNTDTKCHHIDDSIVTLDRNIHYCTIAGQIPYLWKDLLSVSDAVKQIGNKAFFHQLVDLPLDLSKPDCRDDGFIQVDSVRLGNSTFIPVFGNDHSTLLSNPKTLNLVSDILIEAVPEYDWEKDAEVSSFVNSFNFSRYWGFSQAIEEAIKNGTFYKIVGMLSSPATIACTPMNPINQSLTGTYDSFTSYLDESVTIFSTFDNPFKKDFIVTGLEDATYGIDIQMSKVLDGVEQKQTLLKNPEANTLVNQKDFYQCEWASHFTDHPEPIRITTDRDGDGVAEEVHLVPTSPTLFNGCCKNQSIQLSWGKPEHGEQETAGYCIYRKRTATFQHSSVKNMISEVFYPSASEEDESYSLLAILPDSNQSTFTDTSVQPGNEYSYSIESFDSLGFSSSRATAGPYLVTEEEDSSCPELYLEATPNKTSYQYGDLVYLNITLRNLGGNATGVELDIELPRELSLSGCDEYRVSMSGNNLSIAIGNLDAGEVVSFVLRLEVTTAVTIQKSIPIILELSAKECDSYVKRIVQIRLEPARTGKQELGVSLKLLNLEFDDETGKYYLPFDQALELQLQVTGYQQSYSYDIQWGDGETTTVKKETSSTILQKHKFTARGSMRLQITVTDINGRTKTSTLYVTVR